MERSNNSKVVYIEKTEPETLAPMTTEWQEQEHQKQQDLAPTDTGLIGDIGDKFNDALGLNGNTKNVGVAFNNHVGSSYDDRVGYKSDNEEIGAAIHQKDDEHSMVGGRATRKNRKDRKDNTDTDTESESGSESSISSKDIMEIDPFVVRLKMFLTTENGKSVTSLLQDVLVELKKLNENLQNKKE